MLFTIEIMKERLPSSGLPPLTLALTNCRRMPSIASQSATPNAFAMSCSPSPGSGWSMENPCGKSFSRGVASALVWSGAAIAVVMAASEAAVFMSIFLGTIPWHASRKRAAWPRAGDRSPRRPVQFSMVGEYFRPQSQTGTPAGAERRAFTRFRNNGTTPLICPTCQAAVRAPAAPVLLCMGLFSIFGKRALRKGVLHFRRGGRGSGAAVHSRRDLHHSRLYGPRARFLENRRTGEDLGSFLGGHRAQIANDHARAVGGDNQSRLGRSMRRPGSEVHLSAVPEGKSSFGGQLLSVDRRALSKSECSSGL